MTLAVGSIISRLGRDAEDGGEVGGFMFCNCWCEGEAVGTPLFCFKLRIFFSEAIDEEVPSFLFNF